MNNTTSYRPYYNRETWLKNWQDTRSHWRMMKFYGRWDGRAQFFGEWTRTFVFVVYSKRGRILSQSLKRHVGKYDRYEVAERWHNIKLLLKPGQSATITLNGRVTRRFTA